MSAILLDTVPVTKMEPNTFKLQRNVRKTAVFLSKTAVLMVPQSNTEVRATPQKSLKLLHFYGMDTRVSQ